MATHSIILAWRISWTEEPGRLQSMDLQSRDTTEVTEHAHTPLSTEPQPPPNMLLLLPLHCLWRIWLWVRQPHHHLVCVTLDGARLWTLPLA